MALRTKRATVNKYFGESFLMHKDLKSLGIDGGLDVCLMVEVALPGYVRITNVSQSG